MERILSIAVLRQIYVTVEQLVPEDRPGLLPFACSIHGDPMS